MHVHMWILDKCEFGKEGSFCINAKLVKEELNHVYFKLSLPTVNPVNHARPNRFQLNLSLLRCMLFANYSHNFHPIVVKFGKQYFLTLVLQVSLDYGNFSENSRKNIM